MGDSLRSAVTFHLRCNQLSRCFTILKAQKEDKLISLTVEQAYASIKNLEKTGQITLPQPKDTVDVGSIDLILKFFVKGGGVKAIAATAPVKGAATKTTKKVASPPAVKSVNATTVLGLPSGITISGFPTISNTSSAILVDAGLSVSTLLEGSTVTPPVATFPLGITIPGHAAVNIEIVIVRPPVLGMGVFTIPAVPITIVYAPPQGKQLKNSTTYTDMTSFTRVVTTSVSQSKTVKTAEAYTAADYISKIAGAIAIVAAIVGTGGAGAGAVGVAGAIGALFTALAGNSEAQQSALSASDSLKLVSSELSAVSTILTAVDTTTSSDSSTVATQDDHTVKLVLTDMSMFSSTAGQGPGVGDRSSTSRTSGWCGWS